MTRVLLVRHGRTSANAAGVLAGRSPGVHLDDTGILQARAVADLVRDIPIDRIITSPLIRTVETAKLIRTEIHRTRPPHITKDSAFIECDYGKWTGKKLKKLARDPLWSAIQSHPASVTFPDGESMLQAQTRAVIGIRNLIRDNQGKDGDKNIVLVVSHGDIIKSIVADALGMHLDMFQRIVIDPGSVTAIDYTAMRPFVRLLNSTIDVSADLKAGIEPSSDAAVGGGAGHHQRQV
jgi:probable phosphomutase (TIGR03848 family)